MAAARTPASAARLPRHLRVHGAGAFDGVYTLDDGRAFLGQPVWRGSASTSSSVGEAVVYNVNVDGDSGAVWWGVGYSSGMAAGKCGVVDAEPPADMPHHVRRWLMMQSDGSWVSRDVRVRRSRGGRSRSRSQTRATSSEREPVRRGRSVPRSESLGRFASRSRSRTRPRRDSHTSYTSYASASSYYSDTSRSPERSRSQHRSGGGVGPQRRVSSLLYARGTVKSPAAPPAASPGSQVASRWATVKAPPSPRGSPVRSGSPTLAGSAAAGGFGSHSRVPACPPSGGVKSPAKSPGSLAVQSSASNSPPRERFAAFASTPQLPPPQHRPRPSSPLLCRTGRTPTSGCPALNVSCLRDTPFFTAADVSGVYLAADAGGSAGGDDVFPPPRPVWRQRRDGGALPHLITSSDDGFWVLLPDAPGADGSVAGLASSSLPHYGEVPSAVMRWAVPDAEGGGEWREWDGLVVTAASATEANIAAVPPPTSLVGTRAYAPVREPIHVQTANGAAVDGASASASAAATPRSHTAYSPAVPAAAPTAFESAVVGIFESAGAPPPPPPQPYSYSYSHHRHVAAEPATPTGAAAAAVTPPPLGTSSWPAVSDAAPTSYVRSGSPTRSAASRTYIDVHAMEVEGEQVGAYAPCLLAHPRAAMPPERALSVGRVTPAPPGADSDAAFAAFHAAEGSPSKHPHAPPFRGSPKLAANPPPIARTASGRSTSTRAGGEVGRTRSRSRSRTRTHSLQRQGSVKTPVGAGAAASPGPASTSDRRGSAASRGGGVASRSSQRRHSTSSRRREAEGATTPGYQWVEP